MKTKKRFLIGGIGLLTTILFLAGCMDNSRYTKVSEILFIHNGTDSTIYVEYGFLDPISAYYRNETDSVPKNRSSLYQFDDSLIKGLWISEKDFNTYVSKIRIYRLNKGDSTFVAPHNYNTKSAWMYEFVNPEYSDYSFKQNRNMLTILPSMFNQ